MTKGKVMSSTVKTAYNSKTATPIEVARIVEATMESVFPNVERRLAHMKESHLIYPHNTILDFVYGATVDYTKFVQNFINAAIESYWKDNGIDAYMETSNGYDAVIAGNKVEIKVSGGANRDSLATGNKMSKVKVPLTLVIRYEMDYDNDTFASTGVYVVNNDKGAAWVGSGGKKDAFSTLRVYNLDAIDPIIGTARLAVKHVHIALQDVL